MRDNMKHSMEQQHDMFLRTTYFNCLQCCKELTKMQRQGVLLGSINMSAVYGAYSDECVRTPHPRSMK